MLKRLVKLLRACWPQVTIELRADSGFALPAIYAYCEDHQISYTMGLASNDRLEALAAPLAEQAIPERATTGQEVRLLAAGQYRAGS